MIVSSPARDLLQAHTMSFPMFSVPAWQHIYDQALHVLAAKGCRTSWSRQSGGTPQVVGSIPGRDEFPPAGKKIPLPVSCPKHCGAWSNSQGDGPPCTDGAGVRRFSWPAVRRSFYLSNNAVGAVLPPQVKFFSID